MLSDHLSSNIRFSWHVSSPLSLLEPSHPSAPFLLGYGHAVDWWAVGILTYEMRCGRSPFESRSQMEMFKRITKRDYKFPRCDGVSMAHGIWLHAMWLRAGLG